VRGQDWPNIRLRRREEFTWLIPDHMDTTATNTLAAYDRCVPFAVAFEVIHAPQIREGSPLNEENHCYGSGMNNPDHIS
jgi:hypothetical protein